MAKILEKLVEKEEWEPDLVVFGKQSIGSDCEFTGGARNRCMWHLALWTTRNGGMILFANRSTVLIKL
eukprot:9692423-Ditylum_brightwellii.AAC.1